MAGFEFHETMAGSFRLLGEPRDRAMSFTVRARSFTWASFLRRPQVDIEGEIDAEGFADHRYLRGTLGMDPLRTRTLPYAFAFAANDGAPHTFAGTKTLHVGRLLEPLGAIDHQTSQRAQTLPPPTPAAIRFENVNVMAAGHTVLEQSRSPFLRANTSPSSVHRAQANPPSRTRWKNVCMRWVTTP